MDGMMNAEYPKGTFLKKIREESIWRPDWAGWWRTGEDARRRIDAVGSIPPQGAIGIARGQREFLAWSTDETDGIPKDA